MYTQPASTLMSGEFYCLPVHNLFFCLSATDRVNMKHEIQNKQEYVNVVRVSCGRKLSSPFIEYI